MKRSGVLLLTLGLAYGVRAQSDFRTGYIITSKGDTTRGLINYRQGPGSYKFCDFKKSENDEGARYYPGDIAGYRFENDRGFEARKVKLENEISEFVFLEAIVKGAVSLYKVKDQYFAEKGDTAFYHLTNERSIYVVDNQQMLKTSNRYIGILTVLLGDCSGMEKRIAETELREKPLTLLVLAYYECMGIKPVTFKERKPWATFHFGFAAGYYTSSLSVKANTKASPELYYLNGTYTHSSMPTGGLSFELLFPRINERLSMVANLFYVKTKYQMYNESERYSRYERNDVLVSLDQLLIPVGVRYTFPERKFTPYLNGGISCDAHFQSSSRWIRESEGPGEINSYESDAFESRNHQLGYWGGIGIQRGMGSGHRAFAEIRYEQTDGVTSSWLRAINVVRSNITSFQFLAGVKF